jgi:hypothetical protein
MALTTKNLAVRSNIRTAGGYVMGFPASTLTGFATVLIYELLIASDVEMIMIRPSAFAVAA